MKTLGRFSDVIDTLERCKETRLMGIGVYGFNIINQCRISDIHFETEGHENNEYPNIEMRLSYTQRVDNGREFEWVPNSRNLFILNNAGDDKWTYLMKQKIWDNDYPYTIAIDEVTGEVFFVHIALEGIVLKLFGREEGLYDIIKGHIVEREPYRIKIDEDAMFSYIDGAEGYNHLKDNIYIEFNCIGKKVNIRKLEE